MTSLMTRAPWSKILALSVLAAFVVVGIGAVLPHSHAHVAASHDCVFCRAHASPSVEAPAAMAPAPPAGLTASLEIPVFAPGAQPSAVLPFGRAPPRLS